MKNRSRIVCALLLALSAWGCTTTGPGPEEWLPSADDAQRDPRGGWAVVEYVHPSGLMFRLDGELLAVDPSAVYILGGGRVWTVPRDSVTVAQVTFYDSHPGSVVGYAIGGAFASLGTGFWAAYGIPAWIIMGAAGSRSRADDATRELKETSWDELSMYARFPAGLPAEYAALESVPAPMAFPDLPEETELPKNRPRDSEATKETEPDAGPLVAPPRTWTPFWAYVGVGLGYNPEHSGPGYQLTMAYSRRWFMLGLRMMHASELEKLFPQTGSTVVSLDAWDAALLLGARVVWRGVHVSAATGPAWVGSSLGELSDFGSSWGLNTEFFVFPRPDVGIGASLGYDWGDRRDFHVVSFGIAIGLP
jgi:hypothetical protein